MDNQLAAAIYNADEESLISLANKGIYKRAVKDAENAEADIMESETAAEVSVGGEKCVITVPLGESRCTCPSRTVCRHIITAILLLKNRIPEQFTAVEENSPDEAEKPAEVPEIPEERPATEKDSETKLSEAELRKIHSSAEMCMGLLCGVLTHGLVRIPETAAEDFELAAVFHNFIDRTIEAGERSVGDADRLADLIVDLGLRRAGDVLVLLSQDTAHLVFPQGDGDTFVRVAGLLLRQETGHAGHKVADDIFQFGAEFRLNQHVAREEEFLGSNSLSVLDDVLLFNGNQNLGYLVFQITLLDFFLEIFLGLLLLASSGSKDIPFLFAHGNDTITNCRSASSDARM